MTIQLTEKVLAVKVPNYIKPYIHYGREIVFSDKEDDTEYYSLPPGKWEIIGRASEIDEERAKKFMPNKFNNLKDTSWNDVANFVDYERSHITFDKAIESFHSLLRSKGIFLVNPIERYQPGSGYSDWDHQQEWQSAQERVGVWLIVQKLK